MKFCCHDGLVGGTLNVFVNILIDRRVDILLLDLLIDLERIGLLSLTLEENARLAQCQRCDAEVGVVGSLRIGHLGSLLETVDRLVVLVVVGIDVAECHLGCRTDHLVVGRAELLGVLQCLCPVRLGLMGVAECYLEVGKVAGSCAAVVALYLLETGERLVVLLSVEEHLVLCQLCTGLRLARR